jgi:putative transposase
MKDLYAWLELSKQALYQEKKQKEKKGIQEEQILQAIFQIRALHPVMGLKKIYTLIQPLALGRDKFIALAKEHHLQAKVPKNKQRTTFSTKSHRYKNLLVDLLIEDINQVWVSDITYFWVRDRFYYLTLIMDLYSRKIVGYQAAPTLEAQANVGALQMAFQNRKVKKGLIHHSDKGSQYVFKDYTDLLKDHQISMCNTVLENSHCERLNGIIKNEYLIHQKISDLATLKKQLTKTVKLYNEERPHGELGKISPTQFENELKSTPGNEHTKMKIFVDSRTIEKQKLDY